MSEVTRRLAGTVREDESILWLGLWALFLRADGDGGCELSRAAADFRAALLARERSGGGESGTRIRGLERMDPAEVTRYLREALVGRLVSAGLATHRAGPPERVELEPGLWRLASAEGDLLFRELLARGGVAAPAAPFAAGQPVVEAGPAPGPTPAGAGPGHGPTVLGARTTSAPPPSGAAPAQPSVLRAEGLVKAFGGRRVVDEVDLAVRQGEIVGLLGPNGAGKTTTFYMIVGLIKADRGRVFLDDRELTRVPMYRRARAGIGYLSQEPSIFRRLTVEENVMAILETLDIGREERRRRLEELLDELSIKHLRRNVAHSLSGGERRRLEITRALVSRPKFMLLDEPFAGVDPIAVDDIQRIVAELRTRGLGVLITDHNVRETLSITDRAYLMFNGRIHIEGPAEALVNDPEARKMYLGLDFRL